jgi:hypothetical protein
MLERSTDAFAYLTGSFHRSDGDIFASARRALTHRLSPFDRMQCHEIACAFGSALREISGTLCCTDANRSCAGTDLPHSARLMLLLFGLG